jgi:alkanesulfonate monooxygenase SsuD/methylene tetrahydromethanopterin reductase-like flavin-dependent oxidoreductase (luciferase family)
MATPHAGAALRAILTELARAREERLSHTAIVLGANRIESGMSKGHETVADTADAHAALVEHALPLDWQSRFIREVRTIDSVRILQAAARLLAPERLRVVVVGDAAQVRSQLEQLAFGPIELHVARRTSPPQKPTPPPNVIDTGP